MSKRNLGLQLSVAELDALAVKANAILGRSRKAATVQVPAAAFAKLFLDHNCLARFASENGVDVDALPKGVR
jgi:hypothetical protein